MATIGIAIIVTIAIIAAIINFPALTIRAQTTSEETQETESEQSMTELESLAPYECNPAGQQVNRDSNRS